MVSIKRVVLDVLKPHHPNSIEFSTSIAENIRGCRVSLQVSEMDEKTETVILVIEGKQLPYDLITDAISSLGGTVHSIDEVEVESEPDADDSA